MARREASAQQLTNLVAAIYQVYPQAVLDPDSIAEIMPIVREELAKGRSVAQVVKHLCSCDGKKVFPSQAAKVRLRVSGKLAVSKVTDRPPSRDELEEPASVQSLRQRLLRLNQRDMELSGGIALMSIDPGKASVVKAAQKRLTAIKKLRDEVREQLRGALRDRPWAAPIDESTGTVGGAIAKPRRGRPKKTADAGDVPVENDRAVGRRRRIAPVAPAEPADIVDEDEGEQDEAEEANLLNRLSRAAVKDRKPRAGGQ